MSEDREQLLMAVSMVEVPLKLAILMEEVVGLRTFAALRTVSMTDWLSQVGAVGATAAALDPVEEVATLLEFKANLELVANTPAGTLVQRQVADRSQRAIAPRQMLADLGRAVRRAVVMVPEAVAGGTVVAARMELAVEAVPPTPSRHRSRTQMH